MRSAGAIAGDVLVSSNRCHKLPARISTFEPMPLRLLARPVRLTRTDAFLLPPWFSESPSRRRAP